MQVFLLTKKDFCKLTIFCFLFLSELFLSSTLCAWSKQFFDFSACLPLLMLYKGWHSKETHKSLHGCVSACINLPVCAPPPYRSAEVPGGPEAAPALYGSDGARDSSF